MTDTTGFENTADAILAARQPTDLFRPGTEASDYRNLARIVHPDTATDEHRTLATMAFAKLSELYARANGKVEPVVIRTKKGEYPIGDQIAEGDLTNVYVSGTNAVKIPLTAADNDLMEREARAIKRLDAEASADFRHFAPVLIESFRHRDTDTKVERRINVFDNLHDFITLREIIAAFPDGIDPRDAAWMWRRLFVAIGLAYDNDLVHGAVTPENIMIQPEKHGVVLIDWCYSVDTRTDQKMLALAKSYESWYPQSVKDKVQPTHALDVAMACNSMLQVMGKQAPREFRAFVAGCNLASVPTPAELLAEFDELLYDLYGKRKFRPFAMP